ncbi:hypothetical protein GCM10017687_39500 [Streptomyces echinatus]
MLVAPSQKPQPGEPLWWVDRLWKQLAERRQYAEKMRRYYSGDHPLPMIQEKARPGFQRLLKQARSNYVGLVVDATAERLQVDGFRLGAANVGDQELWRIWQANSMDADSDLQLTEAVKVGRSFALVAPNPEDVATPLITAEDATQAIVSYETGSRRRRRAGLKTFTDDWTGDLWTTLFADGLIFKYRAPEPRTGAVGTPRWGAARGPRRGLASGQPAGRGAAGGDPEQARPVGRGAFRDRGCPRRPGPHQQDADRPAHGTGVQRLPAAVDDRL